MTPITNQQHFLKKEFIAKIRSKISTTLLKNKKILEIGIGTGRFTEIYYDDSQNIIAYEIDETLKLEVPHDNIELIYKAFDPQSAIDDTVGCIISAPPYDLLPEIAKFIHLNNFEFILMVSKKYFALFNDFDIVMELSGAAFTPETKKSHFIITNIKGLVND
jgi:16S rRNA A1518/A1519 N6-dimethyltransferase RsmA/KsgA/DIM1 with predicted DNA glycosylase/AP lyase activity